MYTENKIGCGKEGIKNMLLFAGCIPYALGVVFLIKITIVSADDYLVVFTVLSSDTSSLS